MKFLILTILLMLVTSCGGDESSFVKAAPPQKNTPPIIVTAFLPDSSIETLEPFEILLKITDIDNDSITGSAIFDNISVEISTYTGEEDYTHQASFSIKKKGEYIIGITVSDGNNADVKSNINVSILPNKSEVQAVLINSITDFVKGGDFKEVPLLGSTTDEMGRRVGYISTALSELDLAHNANPFGECGVKTPHKLLSVNITSNDITIPDTGLIFPLECISTHQAENINNRNINANDNTMPSSYIAQNFYINNDSEKGLTLSYTGNGIRIEGAIKNITCDGFILSVQDNVFLLIEDDIAGFINKLPIKDDSFILDCTRVVDFEGEEINSLLLANITGEITTSDSTFPTGTINDITFSIPYLDGGLNQGNICATTTTHDNEGFINEQLTLHASDGLVDDLVMEFYKDSNQYCTSLVNFSGGVHISQTITDYSGNEAMTLSETYLIEKNDAPVFSKELLDNIVVKAHQGMLVLINNDDVSDPENQEVTLTGETRINTSLPLGRYSITAIASDPYNAQTSKTIDIELTENQLPTAKLNLIGQYSMIGGSIRDINEIITLSLESEDTDGQVVSSILETGLNDSNYSEIFNYSSNYEHDIRAEGGNTRRFNYLVTDNDGSESETAHLNLTVHLNTPPIYHGNTTYVIERGNCLTVDKIANDSENDAITYTIEGHNWQLCYNDPALITKIVTVTDTYQASSNANIRIEVNGCHASKVWYDNACQVIDSTPDAFSFTTQTNIEKIPAGIFSNSITISGINTEVNASISNGWYDINNSTRFRSTPEKIKNGDTIQLVVLVSDSPNTTSTATITIGGVSADFSVTTEN